jgi:hypothetical protein
MAGDRIETAPGVRAVIKGDTPPEIKPDRKVGWKLPAFVVTAVGALALIGRQIIDPGSGAESPPVPPASAPATDSGHSENGNPGNTGAPSQPSLKIDGNQQGPDFDGDGQGDDTLPMVPNMSGNEFAKADIEAPSVGPAPAAPGSSEPVLPMTQPGSDGSVKA